MPQNRMPNGQGRTTVWRVRLLPSTAAELASLGQGKTPTVIMREALGMWREAQAKREGAR